MLSTDLEGSDDRDNAALDQLLTALVQEIIHLEEDVTNEDLNVAERSNAKEFQLVVLRLFSVLMSRSKSWQGEELFSKKNYATQCQAFFLRLGQN